MKRKRMRCKVGFIPTFLEQKWQCRTRTMLRFKNHPCCKRHGGKSQRREARHAE